jgi:hypothetical protein
MIVNEKRITNFTILQFYNFTILQLTTYLLLDASSKAHIISETIFAGDLQDYLLSISQPSSESLAILMQ